MLSAHARVAAVSAALVLALAGPAAATPIVDTDGSVVTGIQNLEVTARRVTEVFNVTFLQITLDDLQAAGGAPIADGDLPGSASTWADEVTAAIAATLNAVGGVNAFGPDADTSSSLAYVPYSSSGQVERVVYAGQFLEAGTGNVSGDEVGIFAALTFPGDDPILTPEPTTALLLCAGLAGMAAFRRRY